MRPVVLAAMLLATACGGSNTATTPEDQRDLEAAECAEEFEAWDVDFAEDAVGASTPEEALDRHVDQPASLPAGQPVRLSESNGQATFAFLDDGEFSGRASVRELDNGWLVEGAVVCY